MRRSLITFSLLLPIWTTLVVAQPSESFQGQASAYQARFRYEIDAGRTLRFRLYQAMTARLTEAGFKKEPGLAGEELYGNYMAGTLPAEGVKALLQEIAIRTVILIPEEQRFSEDDQVLVKLSLSKAFGPALQRDMAHLARAKLKALNFEELMGYDHQKHQRLLGRMAYGKLNELLKADIEVDIPTSTRQPKEKTPLVRLAEVLPEPSNLPMVGRVSSDPAPTNHVLNKVSPELRRLAEAEPEAPVRVEVILRESPPPNSLLPELVGAPAFMQLEGRLETLVTGTIQGGDLAALAGVRGVSTVRLPQAARDFTGPVKYVSLNQPSTPQESMEAWVRRGPGSKAVVVAHDFRGYKAKIGDGLPAKTHFVDLTIELSTELLPQEGSGEEGIGSGTQMALELMKSAPVEEVVLVRIDTASPFQLKELAEALDSGLYHSFALYFRKEELRRESARLESERTEIRVLRRLSLDNFGIDDSAKEARERYRERQRQFDESAVKHGELDRRMLEFMKAVRALQGAQTVIIGLNWTDGHPDLSGSPPTLRLLKSTVKSSSASWIQAVPQRTHQVWTGLFRDQNQDGVMEFAAESTARNDLNFLRWQPKEGASQATLPAGSVLQVMLQWQEAHDPNYFQLDDDLYRQPLTTLRILLLRQRDPSGQKLPDDVFDVIAMSSGWPDRVEHLPRSSVYQAQIRVQIPQEGRYALQILGEAPTGIAPAGSAEIIPQRTELHPKLIIDTIDPAHRARGSIQLQSHSSGE